MLDDNMNHNNFPPQAQEDWRDEEQRAYDLEVAEAATRPIIATEEQVAAHGVANIVREYAVFDPYATNYEKPAPAEPSATVQKQQEHLAALVGNDDPLLAGRLDDEIRMTGAAIQGLTALGNAKRTPYEQRQAELVASLAPHPTKTPRSNRFSPEKV